MIDIETSVTGSQIASSMLFDEEEFFYFLERMAKDASEDFIGSLSGYAGSTEGESITSFCEKIIAALKDE
nr:hypothetical protein [uncultured Cohaesibacter sp.]